MGKKWVELLYNNQSAMSSFAPQAVSIDEFEEHELYESPQSFDPELNQVTPQMLLKDRDFRVLDSLERVNRMPELRGVDEPIRRLKDFVPDISIEMRLNVLTEFNALLRSLSYSHVDDKKIFRQCLEVVINFKRLMDKQDQRQSSRMKAEWVQLEKAIYYLTVWESQMDQGIAVHR